jgi:putative ABC transport system substrate-binding protein
MRRREFITLLGGAAAAWPLAARAEQQDRLRRVGVLMSLAEDDRQGQRYVAALLHGLQELGWNVHNLHIDVRWGAADIDRIRGQASELVDLKPNVILAQSALALTPIQRRTSTIPIVFVQVVDPVGSDFVASLKGPSGNITGFADAEFSMSGKMLEVLKEIAPRVRRVAVIHNPVQAPQIAMWHAIEAVAPSLGVEVSPVSPRVPAEIRRTVESFSATEPASGVVVLPNPVTNLHRELIIALMARNRLPAIYAYPYLVSEGGLISYGTDPAGQFRQAALYIVRILTGAKPADLPVQQPTKFELAINLKTAKALGLDVPPTLLARADEVIE